MAYTDIDDPSEYFTTLLYTGNATDNRNLTNSANAGDFKPDWLWLKERSSTSSHQLHDSTRGSSFALMSDSTAVEDEDANRVQAFQTNGFQVGTASTVNQNTITMVAWQWKCNGGTTSSNTEGDITSTVQANTTAGFSIVSWAGQTATNPTIGHGLSIAPTLVITKNRTSGNAWLTGVTQLGFNWNTDYYHLNSSDAKQTNAGGTGFHRAPTSTTISSGGFNHEETSSNYIAYCFHSVQGYSKIGSYVGNANANGAFVYLGFKPAFVIIKKSSGGENWSIVDNKRSPFNVMDERLVPNSSAVEESNQGGGDSIDFVSNGFKCRDGAGQFNDANTYVYMAFAEHPFVSSEGVPTTAR